jgi:spermidine synthase
MWGFILGSKKHDPANMNEEEVNSTLKRREVENLKFYSGKIHKSLLTLPEDLEGLLRNQGRVATDSKPIFMPI